MANDDDDTDGGAERGFSAESINRFLSGISRDKFAKDFSKCISQNVFLKMYFSKCIFQNVFLKMYLSKCISQNVFLKMWQLSGNLNSQGWEAAQPAKPIISGPLHHFCVNPDHRNTILTSFYFLQVLFWG